MCGICGKVYCEPDAVVEKALLLKMSAVLRHRGPDEDGVYVEGPVGLGHRRLSIIDLSTGRQPMCNERRDLWIVFNGEIYNFPLLRRDLEQRGYRFQTHSDTEVILHMYAEYGPACVDYLRGMFAFAIWDAGRRRLFLARDRVGQKPLYYVNTGGFLAFGSESKALLQDPHITPALNLTAMSNYLTYQYVPPPDTMYQDILQLPPAHTLLYEDGQVTVRNYWNLRYTPKTCLSVSDMRIALTGHFQDAVSMRMNSDVPLGAFLSGGIDSSLIVACMAQQSSQPVKTFSIGFREKAFNELPYARMVAEHFKTEHHEFVVEPNAVEILPELIRHFDEPFGDFSAIPTYYVAKMTSQFVKVALNGDGGDESFAGYLRYAGSMLARLYQHIPAPLRQVIAASLPAIFQGAPSVRIARYLKYLHDLSFEPPETLYLRTMTIFQNALKTDLFTPDVNAQIQDANSLDYALRYFQAENAEDFIDKMLYSDVMTYLPGDLLVKVDRMTMAHSLEGRSPFLDHTLMEFAAGLPARQKMRGTRLKLLLKELGKQWLPKEILTRPKQGFGVPIGAWFRNELRDMVHDILTSSLLARDGVFQAATLQRILHEHQNGTMNHHHRIWLLINSELWYRACICHA